MLEFFLQQCYFVHPLVEEQGKGDHSTDPLNWQWGGGAGLRGPLGPASSLTGPVLSCPEALRCAQLGSAQCRARRGGSRPEAGSTRPRRPCTRPGLLSLTPAGPGSGPEASRLAFCTWQKKIKTAGPLSPKPPEVLTLGFPQHLERGKKKSGPYSHRIKLDLTSQQLKEVTTLTPTLPGSQRAAGLEHWLWSALEMIQRCKYFEKAEWKA